MLIPASGFTSLFETKVVNIVQLNYDLWAVCTNCWNDGRMVAMSGIGRDWSCSWCDANIVLKDIPMSAQLNVDWGVSNLRFWASCWIGVNTSLVELTLE